MLYLYCTQNNIEKKEEEEKVDWKLKTIHVFIMNPTSMKEARFETGSDCCEISFAGVETSSLLGESPWLLLPDTGSLKSYKNKLALSLQPLTYWNLTFLKVKAVPLQCLKLQDIMSYLRLCYNRRRRNVGTRVFLEGTIP